MGEIQDTDEIGYANFYFPPPMVPKEYEIFNMQIAGHQYQKGHEEMLSILLEKSTGHILKPYQVAPRGERERDFYQAILKGEEEGDPSFIELGQLTPSFYCSINIPVSPIRNHDFLVMENLVRKFKKPCVMDVKIGYRTWDPEANETKKTYEMTKYPFAKTLGFRLLGIKVYNNETGLYESRDKHWGKKVADTGILSAFDFFFNTGSRDVSLVENIVGSVIAKTKRVQSWFEKQTLLIFYSSSLLILYEGDPTSKQQTELRMIDFTHVFPSGGKRDVNYLEGVGKFLEHLSLYKASLKNRAIHEPI